MHDPPEVFDPCRILADQPFLEIRDRGRHGFVGSHPVRLAVPVQVFVGHHLDINVVAAAEVGTQGLDVGDFHERDLAKRHDRVQTASNRIRDPGNLHLSGDDGILQSRRGRELPGGSIQR